MTSDQTHEMRALDWVIRQRDPDFEAWEEFADWMAQDPAHSAAYHELAALDAEAGDLAAMAGPPAETVPVPANDDDYGAVLPVTRRGIGRRGWIGGAIAASLVGIVSLGLLNRPTDNYRIETAMGESQEVKLADGSRIAVNGGSSLLLSHADPRRAVLERGQALFKVVHRPDAPFRVGVGEAELVDVGTVFDVTRNEDGMIVAVSEGAVVYNPAAQNVRVDAGHRLAVRAGIPAQVVATNAEAVGGWQDGQLSYDGVPLAMVAAELTRTTGIEIGTSPAAGGILFRGTLQIGTGAGVDRAQIVADLAALSGTRATQETGRWTLSR